jgi:hypothetical protein
MTKLFQGKHGGVPFPRTEGEWIEKKMVQGFSYEDAQKEATHRLRQDVFGSNYALDAKGNPVEVGLGSKHQQSHQHKMALKKAEEARAAMRSKVGYTAAVGGPGTFDPRNGA